MNPPLQPGSGVSNFRISPDGARVVYTADQDNPGTPEVYSVPVVDCGELHSSELYATVEITAFDSTYPVDDELFNWVNARCEEQFSAYVGEPYEDSRYWIEVFYPTEDGWDENDRTGLCTVVLVDQNLDTRPSLGSARGWGERAA